MIFIPDEKVEAALEYLRTSAATAAQASADRLYMEEYRKVLKAKLMCEHDGIALGAQEREAYADPRYDEHLRALTHAVEADCRQRFLRVAAEATIEAWRTCSSNERAMKL